MCLCKVYLLGMHRNMWRDICWARILSFLICLMRLSKWWFPVYLLIHHYKIQMLLMFPVFLVCIWSFKHMLCFHKMRTRHYSYHFDVIFTKRMQSVFKKHSLNIWIVTAGDIHLISSKHILKSILVFLLFSNAIFKSTLICHFCITTDSARWRDRQWAMLNNGEKSRLPGCGRA